MMDPFHKTTAMLITARMTSDRLPGKAVADICGQQALALMLRRLVGAVDYLVVAAPDDGTSEPIRRAIPPNTATLYLGHPDDLLSRLAGAARSVKADILAIAGADCPLLDPWTLRLAVEAVRDNPGKNVQTRGWPIGMNVQALTPAMLYEADAEARDPDERIFYNTWFDRRPKRYPLLTVNRQGADEYPHRVTLDTPGDLALLQEIVGALGSRCTAEEVIAWLHANPDADRMTRGGWNYHPDTQAIQ